jgi:YD repeat-containing protein
MPGFAPSTNSLPRVLGFLFVACMVLLGVSAPSLLLAEDGERDVSSLDEPPRDEFLSQISVGHVTEGLNDRVDPFSGYLHVTMPLFSLPGWGDQALAIQMYYSSNIWNRTNLVTPLHSPAQDPSDHLGGGGWQLHMGKIVGDVSNTSTVFHPTLIMPDGSTHAIYKSAPHYGELITREGWRIKRVGGTWEVLVTDGTVLVFDETQPDAVYTNHTASSLGRTVYQCTSIRDLSGNTIDITYDCLSSPCKYSKIDEITFDPYGSVTDSRKVEFTYVAGSNHIDKIRVKDGTTTIQEWDFDYASSAKPTIIPNGTSRNIFDLLSVEPPAGNAWEFSYSNESLHEDGKWALDEITLPTGARVEYAYRGQTFDTGATCSNSVEFMVVDSRVVFDRGGSKLGTWSWTYDDAGEEDATTTLTIRDGANVVLKTDETTFHGWGGSDYMMWRVGRPKSRSVETKQSGATLQSVSTTWSWTEGSTASTDVQLSPTSWHGCANTIFENSVKFVKPTQVQTIVTRNGGTYTTTQSGFDDYGNPGTVSESSSDGLSRTTTLDYFENSSYNIHVGHVEERNPNPGGLECWSYDTKGRMTRQRVNPTSCASTNGIETRFKYDSGGNLTRRESENTPYDQWTDYESYRFGVPERIEKYNNSGNITIDRDVNAFGSPVSETDGRGSVSSNTYRTYYSYDGLNRLTRIDPPIDDTADTTFSYASNLSIVTVSRGDYQIDYYFDGLGRHTRTQDRETSHRVDTTYNALGVATQKVERFGASLGDTAAYDAVGRLTRITRPDGTAVARSYFQSDETVQDEKSRTTRYEFDAFGSPNDKRLMMVRDADNQSTYYRYDSGQGLLTKIDAPGSKGDREFDYTTQQFLESETHKETGEIQYQYDKLGNVTRRYKGSQYTYYRYDRLGQLTKTDYPNPTPDVDYDYDESGRRTEMTNSTGTFEYVYDANGRLTRKRTTIPGLPGGSRDVGYEYDAMDRRSKMVYPSGREVSYRYDNRSWVTKVASSPGETDYVSSITYHPTGSIDDISYGNGVATSYGIDNRHRVESIATSGPGGSLLSLGFDYDPVSNLTSWTDSRPGGHSRTFRYDKLDRLTKATSASLWGGDITYRYDALGNRLTKTDSQGTTNYSYDSKNRLTAISGAETGTYRYDSSGRMTGATLPDTKPPGPVTNLSVLPGSGGGDGSHQMTLSWTNPGDADLTKIAIYRSTSGFPEVGEGQLVFNQAGSSFTDSGLNTNIRYFYSVFAADEVPNLSSPAHGWGKAGPCPNCDVDLVVGLETGGAVGVANIGSTLAPAWRAQEQWDTDSVYDKAFALADLDNDGDLDLIGCGQSQYCRGYENQGTLELPEWVSKTAWDVGVAVDYLAMPTLGDLDGDGDYDLVVGVAAGTLVFFENTGDATAPVWASAPIDWSSGTFDIGDYAAPALADLNGDGLLDMIVGRRYGDVRGFVNVGIASEPAWQQASSWNIDTSESEQATPVLADLDGDLDADLLMCLESDGCVAYRNDGGATNADWTMMPVGSSWHLSDMGWIRMASAGDLDREYTPPPVIEFAAASIQVHEDAGPAILDVCLAYTTNVEVLVSYESSDGSAASGVDYTSVSDVLSISAGELCGQIQIEILPDAIYELAEDLTVTLSSPQNAGLGDQTQTVVEILDGDTAPSISLSLGSYSTSEDAGSVTLSAVLSHPSAVPLSFRYATSNGSATSGNDYLAANQSASFSAMDTVVPIDIQLVDDTFFEQVEDFSVLLSSVGGSTIGYPSSATVTITDDEETPEVYFGSSTYSVMESGTASLTVRTSVRSADPITVVCTSADGAGDSGATAGDDYASFQRTVTILAGNWTASTTVETIDDEIWEDTETFSAALSSPSGAVLGNPHTTTISITENEQFPVLTFEQTPVQVSEDVAAGQVELSVVLSPASVREVSFTITTSNGSAFAGQDYQSVSGTRTIPALSTSYPINVGIVDDDIYEGLETFTATISNPTNASIGAPNTAEVRIADDEPQPVVEFSVASTSVSEDSGSVVLEINLSGVTQDPVSFRVTTADGTATSGVDFIGVSNVLRTIQPPQVSDSFGITLVDDVIYEGDEAFSVVLSQVQGAGLGSTHEMTVTIEDDEPQVTVSFEVGAYSIDETGGSVGVAVCRNTSDYGNVVVGLSAAGVSASPGDDFSPPPNSVTIPQGTLCRTESLSIHDDSVREGDEVFRLTLDDPSGADLVEPVQAIVTILDDEPLATIMFAEPGVKTTEGFKSVSIPVHVSHPTSTEVSARFTTSDGSAEAGEDYLAADDRFVIEPLMDEAIVQVHLDDDKVFEGDEEFFVALSEPDGVVIGSPANAEVRLLDDEKRPQVTLSDSAYEVEEDGVFVTIRANLSVASDEDVSVQLQTADITALGGTDYTPFNGPVVIPALANGRDTSIDIHDDGSLELNETFQVHLSSPQGADLGAITDAVVTIIDNDNLLSDPGFEQGGVWGAFRESEYPGTSLSRGQWQSGSPHSGLWAYSIGNLASGRIESDPVSVSPNTQYDLSVMARGYIDAEESGGDYSVHLLFYDAMDALLTKATVVAGVPGPIGPTKTQWTSLSGSALSPEGATSARIRLTASQINGWIAFDSVHLNESGSGINLAPDPSFEDPVPAWTPTTWGTFPATSVNRSTWGASHPYDGAYAWSISNLAHGRLKSRDIPITAGTTYDLSAFVSGFVSEDQSASSYKLYVEYFAKHGALLSRETVVNGGTGLIGAPPYMWTQVAGQTTAPKEAETAKILITLLHADGWFAIDGVWFAPPGSRTNFAPDPSFENGGSDWVVSEVPAYPGTSIHRGTSGPATPYHGTYAWTMNNLGWGTLESEAIEVVPYSEYDVYSWVRGFMDQDQSLGGIRVEARFYDARDYLIESHWMDFGAEGPIGSSQDEWVYLGGRVTAPAEAVKMRGFLSLRLASGWVAFDDVAASKVPFTNPITIPVSESAGETNPDSPTPNDIDFGAADMDERRGMDVLTGEGSAVGPSEMIQNGDRLWRIPVRENDDTEGR